MHAIIRYFLVLTIFLSMIPAGLSVRAAEPAKVGEYVPHSLRLQDQDGMEQTFDCLVADWDSGVVLFFVRSADWCPYCKSQLAALNEDGKRITDLGYNIAVISRDSVDVLNAYVDGTGFAYTMLSDPDSAAIKTFGILNKEVPENSPYFGIPHPAVYVTGADGRIQAVLAEEGYKSRPSVDSIIKAIQVGAPPR